MAFFTIVHYTQLGKT